MRRSALPRRAAAAEAARKVSGRPLSGLRCGVAVFNEDGTDASTGIAVRLQDLGAAAELE